MKQYVVDTLRYAEYQRLKSILDIRYGSPVLGGIYWIPLPEAFHTAIQIDHGACGPHVVALDLEETRIVCEFLVRTSKSMHCLCMGYATVKQRNWMMDTVDALLEEASVIA